MIERAPDSQSLVAEIDQTLIAVPFEKDGRWYVRYFVDDAAAEAAVADEATEDALALAGVWSDLDWEEMAEALDRIRHESEPTPPIEL